MHFDSDGQLFDGVGFILIRAYHRLEVIKKACSMYFIATTVISI